MEDLTLDSEFFFETYKPVRREDGENHEYFFETYGDDFEFVKAQSPDYVWTVVDGDIGTYIVQGLHFVNRVNYLIATKPYKEGEPDEYIDHLYSDMDDLYWNNSSHTVS